MVKVLFVCTNNICRSPTAEGVLRHQLKVAGLERLVLVDSAGTHDHHAGEAPDPRTQAAARKRGYDLSRLRSRPIHADDLRKFDHLLAMDEGHLTLLRRPAARPSQCARSL